MTPEIRAFEYAIGVFAVLIRPCHCRYRYQFPSIAPLRGIGGQMGPSSHSGAALYAMCMAIYMWFDLWGVRNFAATRHFLFYLLLFAQLFVLFLVAASSLPDEASASTDLREFYAANRRKFWLLVVLFQVGYVGAGFYFIGGMIAELPRLVTTILIVQMIAPLVLALALLATKSRVVHCIGIGLLFVVMFFHYGRMSIN